MPEEPTVPEPTVPEPTAPEPTAPDPTAPDPTALEQRAAEVLHAAEEVAAATGRAMVSEAKDVRRRILQDATKRRAELVTELERVRELLDRALDALRSPMRSGEGEPEETVPVAAPTTTPDNEPAPPSAVPAHDVFARLRAAKRARPTPPRTPSRRGTTANADDPRSSAPTDVSEAGSPVGATDDRVEAADETTGADAGGASDTEPPTETPSDPDDVPRGRRDAVLEPLVPGTVRAAKRLLQDEQNSLLDAIRRARGRYEPPRLLPEHEHQREAWVSILTPTMDAAFLGGRAASGKTGRVSAAPTRVVGHALAIVVTQLRDRLAATIEMVVAEGPYESPNELQRALGSAIGARYREWKSAELEARVRDAACAAYARGSFEAAGVGTPLRWVPADPGRCPDCDDNALEPTVKGSPFPTGQSHPPAHPGCRCLVVPLERGGGPTVIA